MKVSTILEVTGTSISFVGTIIDKIGEEEVKEKLNDLLTKVKSTKIKP